MSETYTDFTPRFHQWQTCKTTGYDWIVMVVEEGTCNGDGWPITYKCIVLDGKSPDGKHDETGTMGHWFECDLSPVKMHFYTESIRETNILRIVRDEVSE